MLYPTDPGLDLLSITYYTDKKDFARARECVDRLETAVGGDPYLDVTRAAINRAAGKYEEARRLARMRHRERAHLGAGLSRIAGPFAD